MSPSEAPSRRTRLAIAASLLLSAGLLLFGLGGVVSAQSAGGSSLRNVAGLDLIVADSASTVASSTEEVVAASTSGDVDASVTIPPAGIDPGSTITASSVPDAAEQFQFGGLRPPGGTEVLAAMAVDGHTANGLPLPVPFADRPLIRIELAAEAVPESAGTGNFELGTWDGTEWTFLIPAVSIREDGAVVIRERVTAFAPLYVVLHVPSRIVGEPRPGDIALLVAVVRSDAEALVEALTAKGCDVTTIAVLRGTRWRTYIPGAPEVINDDFPSAALPQEPFFVRCA